MRRRIVLSSLAAGLAVVALAGCSSSDEAVGDSSAGDSAAVAPGVPEPGPGIVEPDPNAPSSEAGVVDPAAVPGGDPATAGMIGPVMVGPQVNMVEVEVGRSVVFDEEDPAAWTVTVDDPQVLAVQNGGKQGDAIFNPGGLALSEGIATVTLTSIAGDERVVTVTVLPAPDAGAVGEVDMPQGDEPAVDMPASDVPVGEDAASDMPAETPIEPVAPTEE